MPLKSSFATAHLNRPGRVIVKVRRKTSAQQLGIAWPYVDDRSSLLLIWGVAAVTTASMTTDATAGTATRGVF